jgi:hypothetical protein
VARVAIPGGLVVLAVISAGCAKKEVPIVEVRGECADVYKGQICTWAHMQGTTLVDVGATIPVASVENAPNEPDMAWPPVALARLQLPKDAQGPSGMTELTVYWEAAGHPPGPYMTPHFDFHFYTIAPTEQAAIDCKDNAKPATLAAGYSLPDQDLPPDMARMIGVKTLVGICIPGMGMHSLPTAELESKEPFTGDMVIGYYATKPVFIEPMITRALLMEKKAMTFPVPAIPGMTGNRPGSWRADYDSTATSYRFVFSGFTPGS